MTHTRPYVDRRVTDQPHADGVADAAARQWGLAPPTLLRSGMNAIYACGDIVLRVGHATAPAASSHALVTTLIDHGIPTVPPVAGLVADIGDLAVSGWTRIHPLDAPIDWGRVGEAVARVHDLDPKDLPIDYPIPSPASFPWWDFDSLLATVEPDIDARALEGLLDALTRGSGWEAAVADATVVCHGDVHPGNVLMTAEGPLLIDWDLLCRAAPAWDHAMLTTYASRWGGDANAYEAFAHGYGRSMRDDPTALMVAELRNVAATLMRVRAGIVSDSARIEAERRLRFWRGDSDAPAWRAQ